MTYTSREKYPSMDSLIAALSAMNAGSFSAAALDLGVTHAAISRRIETLENWAGEKIFDRQARGVKVTESGQRILVRIQHALDQIQFAGASTRGERGFPVVRIAVTPSFARFWLLPRMALIEGTPQTLRLEIYASLTHADIQGGEVDLAVRYGHGNWNAIKEVKLFEELLVPVVSSKLLGSNVPVSATSVARLPLLHSSDTTGWRTWAKKHQQNLQTKAQDRILPDYALSVEAASAGLGVALWNSSIHDAAALPPELIQLSSLAVANSLGYYLLTREPYAESPPAIAASRLLRHSQGSTTSTTAACLDELNAQ